GRLTPRRGESISNVGQQQFDPRLDLAHERFCSAGVCQVTAIEEQVFVDEGCLTTQQIVARADPSIMQEASPCGKRKDPPQEGSPDGHCRSLVMVFIEIAPETGQKPA